MGSDIGGKKQLSKQQKVRRRENLSLVYNYETAKSLPASANMPFRYTLHWGNVPQVLSKVNSFKKYLNILITIPTNKSFPWKSDMRGLLNVYVTKFVCETHQFAISRCHFSHPPGPYRWHSYLYGCHIYFPSLNLYDNSSNWREDLNRECVCLYSLFMWKITVEGGVYVKG